MYRQPQNRQNVGTASCSFRTAHNLLFASFLDHISVCIGLSGDCSHSRQLRTRVATIMYHWPPAPLYEVRSPHSMTGFIFTHEFFNTFSEKTVLSVLIAVIPGLCSTCLIARIMSRQAVTELHLLIRTSSSINATENNSNRNLHKYSHHH